MKHLCRLFCLFVTVMQAQPATTEIKAVEKLSALRQLVGMAAGDEVYVKNHSYTGDGGGGFFMWMDNAVLRDTLDYFGKDNNGTLVKATDNNSGRWVRQYDGYISVKWFAPVYNNSTPALQAAIDFAANNSRINAPTKGSTVFIPAGGYIVDALLLHNGVEVLGDSNDKTIFYAMLPEEGSSNSNYMFTIPEGPVQISVSNLNIVGRDAPKGCFHFKAQPASGGLPHGGLWLSSFRNIKINGFAGNGLYLEGGSESQLLPNQFLLFELMDIHLSHRAGKEASALKMTGQNGQVTFINTAFNGYNNNNSFHTGRVAEISQGGKYISAVVSFINASFQEGNYGLYIGDAENIKVDNCWFENLGVAVTVSGSVNTCRGITITNNRFANAAGYGSIAVPEENINKGSCIDVLNALVSVTNNYVLVSQKTARSIDDTFIRARGNRGKSNPGVTISGNSFAFEELGTTTGLTPVVETDAGVLGVKSNQMVFVTGAGTVDVVTLKGNIAAGEVVYISPSGGAIRFKGSGNIRLSGRRSLTLNEGEVAAFIKTDDNGQALFRLVSVTK